MGHEDEMRTLGALDLEGSGFAERESQKRCKTCDRNVQDWPMAFRGDDYCSVLCEKYKGPKDAPKEEPKEMKKKKPKKKALIQMGADE